MISAIVPIYNTPIGMLENCVNSVIEQSVGEWELLLIDDGSETKCAHFCDVLSEKDVRIRVIHIPNGGVSNARNVGIQNAVGEYLCFIDSDDWISPDYFEILLSSRDKASIIASSIIMFNESFQSKDVMHKISEDILCQDQDILISAALGDSCKYECLMLNTVWGKMYPIKLIQQSNILFHSELKRLEDCLFNIELILAGANAVFLSKRCGYYYRVSNDSTMGRFNDDLPKHILCATKAIYNTLNKQFLWEKYKVSYGIRVFKNIIIVTNDWYFNCCNNYPSSYKKNYINVLLYDDSVRKGLLNCQGKTLGKFGYILLQLLKNRMYNAFIMLYSVKRYIKR